MNIYDHSQCEVDVVPPISLRDEPHRVLDTHPIWDASIEGSSQSFGATTVIGKALTCAQDALSDGLI